MLDEKKGDARAEKREKGAVTLPVQKQKHSKHTPTTLFFPLSLLSLHTLSYSALRKLSHFFANYFSHPTFICEFFLTPHLFLQINSHSRLFLQKLSHFFAIKFSHRTLFCEIFLMTPSFLQNNSISLRNLSHCFLCR